MLPVKILSIGILAPLVHAATVQRRTADTHASEGGQVEQRADILDQKYFHESYFDSQYDRRFGSKKLNATAQRAAVKVLVQTYLSTFSDLKIETWIMHESLLGWWWNKKVLHWDSDADVRVSEGTINYLAAYYNMTTFYYKYPAIPHGRFFQLEVNPNYVYRDQGDPDNAVDARWIDMENGLFIDITAVRYNLTHSEEAGVLSCKDGREYLDADIFPLLDTTFEGVKAKIPFHYRQLLATEYGEAALANPEPEDSYKIIQDTTEWAHSDDL